MILLMLRLISYIPAAWFAQEKNLLRIWMASISYPSYLEVEIGRASCRERV